MRRPVLRDFLPTAACLALIALTWAAVWILANDARRGTEREAAALRQTLADSLAEHQAASVRAIDMSLVFLQSAWMDDPALFDAAVRRHEHLLRNEKVIQVAVLDREGWVVYSRLPMSGRINFADRTYFKQQRASTDDQLQVSEPVQGRITGKWALQFTRPLRSPAGEFLGLVVVAVEPPALLEAARVAELGSGGAILLVRKDGTVLASTPGAVPGVERLYAHRALPDYPMGVSVGQRMEAVLEPYFEQRRWLAIFGSAATALLLVIMGLLELRRRDQARFEAERERVMLELHDGCIQSIYGIGLNLQGARGQLPGGARAADALIAQAGADLNLVIQDLRAFMDGEKAGVRSPAEFREALLRSLPRTDRPRFEAELEDAAIDALGPDEASHVLRIVREAGANVARHAQAAAARVRLRLVDGQLELEVCDDGRGIAAPASSTGLGLAHIQARARKLKGTAEIGAAENGGTRLRVRFPSRP